MSFRYPIPRQRAGQRASARLPDLLETVLGVLGPFHLGPGTPGTGSSTRSQSWAKNLGMMLDKQFQSPSFDTSDTVKLKSETLNRSLFEGDFLQAVPSKLFHLTCAVDTWKAADPLMHRHGCLKMGTHNWTCSQGLTNGFKKPQF